MITLSDIPADTCITDAGIEGGMLRITFAPEGSDLTSSMRVITRHQDGAASTPSTARIARRG